jgi:L-ascorbate 6-phosphate lactonase
MIYDLLFDDINTCKLKNDEFALWWLGQQGYVLKHGGLTLFLDPFLSDIHDRLIPPLLNSYDMIHADFVFGSHDHDDHIDRLA